VFPQWTHMQSNAKEGCCWLTEQNQEGVMNCTGPCSLVYVLLCDSKSHLGQVLFGLLHGPQLSNPVMILCGAAVLTNYHPATVLLQTDSETDTGRQKDRQAGRQKDRQANRETRQRQASR
jgi:hypothetical protein